MCFSSRLEMGCKAENFFTTYLRRLGINRGFADIVEIGVTLNSGVENCNFFALALLARGVVHNAPGICFVVSGSISMLSLLRLLELKAMVFHLKMLSFL